MRKIIFINRYYAPDHSATAQLLTDLAEQLAAKNLNVLVITSRLSYEDSSRQYLPEEIIRSVFVKRIWTTSFGRANLIGRSLDYLTFYISCFLTLLFNIQKNDFLIAKTDPPMISVVAALAAKIKKGILINWIQDLFPEVVEAVSPSKVVSVLLRVTKSLRNWSLSQAVYNVVIGQLMLETLLRQKISIGQIKTIPNWVIGEQSEPLQEDIFRMIDEWGLTGKFVVGYSGNLGRAHDYKTILATIEKLQDQNDIVFLFVGSGAGMDLLKKSIHEKKLTNVVFKPYQPIELLPTSLSIPNIHLITLQPELEGFIVPSKFYGVIAAHKPILYIGSKNGELGKIIDSHQCGAVFESGKAFDIGLWIQQAYKNPTQLLDMSAASRLLYKNTYNRQASLHSWINLLND